VPGPFYNAIKGTTAGTAGTGAFTPSAASSSFRAWSTVPAGWIGLVRFEDGSDWELSYCYWNGTTLSRGANQRYDSSTGSVLTLTSAATAAMIADANEVCPDNVGYPARGYVGNPATTQAPTAIAANAATVTGTAASSAFGGTNFLTRQPRSSTASATTANAQAGYSNASIAAVMSSASGIGGWCFNCRFGASTLPTGPRLFIGLTSTTFVASTAEPSALVASYAILGKDSTDTNLQIITNDGTTGGTKIDTGIALAVGGWYDITLWTEPGSLTIYYLLIRMDTGAIFYGGTSTDIPPTNAALMMQVLGGLNATNTGTAFTMNMGHALIRTAA